MSLLLHITHVTVHIADASLRGCALTQDRADEEYRKKVATDSLLLRAEETTGRDPADVIDLRRFSLKAFAKILGAELLQQAKDQQAKDAQVKAQKKKP